MEELAATREETRSEAAEGKQIPRGESPAEGRGYGVGKTRGFEERSFASLRMTTR